MGWGQEEEVVETEWKSPWQWDSACARKDVLPTWMRLLGWGRTLGKEAAVAGTTLWLG